MTETLAFDRTDLDVEGTIANMERDFAADPRDFGSIALHGEIDTSYLDAGIDELTTFANTEQDKRVHDIDAAFDMALEQNTMLDAHAEALRENELFDAHVAALEENEERTQKEEAEASEEQEEPDEPVAQDEKHSPETDQYSLPEAIDTSYRKQAEVALKDAGYMESIPLDSSIQKDFVTGNLMIIGNNDVKILESRPGGQTRVTEYAYDDDKKVLTIRSQSGIVTAKVGDFVQTDANNWQQYADVITLPPVVAKSIGVEKVIPIAQAASR
ncbi:MAG: hypothetical protein ACQR33_00905 [Candidatus Saccharibacteria bacterium]